MKCRHQQTEQPRGVFDAGYSGFAEASNAKRITPVGKEAGEQRERLCYWCKHPDHGDKVCPVPYLARGEGNIVGSYPCGCTHSTVLSDVATPPVPVAEPEEQK